MATKQDGDMGLPSARKEFDEVARLAPGMYEAANTMSRAINAAGLDRGHLELAKIRASQMNGCAQCLGMHLNNARAIGMDPQKLDLIAVWPEAGIFDDKELAVLRWTEALTDLVGHEVTDGDYEAINAHFSEAEVAALSGAIAQINFYNRLGNAYRMSPPRHHPAML